MKSTIYFVGVCFSYEPSIFISKLAKLCARSGYILAGVVVSNNPDHSLESKNYNIQVLRGTNLHLDFSGYFDGLKYLISSNSKHDLDLILFVNDSLFVKHAAPTIVSRLLNLSNLIGKIQIPAISGKADSYKSICSRNPWSGDLHYISSYCFLLNSPAFRYLQMLLSDAAQDGVLENLKLEDSAWGFGLSGVMREFIRAHLIYHGSPYIWANYATASAETINRKAHCVYFEHRLSGLIGMNGALLPINSGARANSIIYIMELSYRVVRSIISFLYSRKI